MKKVYDFIEDNPEALEETNEYSLDIHTKDDNLEVNM